MHYKSFGETGNVITFLPRYVIMAMKLTIALMILGALHVSAAGYSQKITLSGNMTLEEALIAIGKQSGYFFFYKKNELQQAKTVTLNLREVTLEQALKVSFGGQPFAYRIEDRTIVVSRKEAPAAAPVQPAMQERLTGQITGD